MALISQPQQLTLRQKISAIWRGLVTRYASERTREGWEFQLKQKELQKNSAEGTVKAVPIAAENLPVASTPARAEDELPNTNVEAPVKTANSLMQVRKKSSIEEIDFLESAFKYANYLALGRECKEFFFGQDQTGRTFAVFSDDPFDCYEIASPQEGDKVHSVFGLTLRKQRELPQVGLKKMNVVAA